MCIRDSVDFAARLADHDAGAGSVDVDRDLTATLDRDAGEAGVGEFAFDVGAQLEVLLEHVGETLLVEPVRLPVLDVADAEAAGMDLLSHGLPQSSSGINATAMWLVRLLIGVARPSARGR